MASIKQKRLEGIIRKNLTEIIQFELKNQSVGFVTITDVKVSNDHSYATVYVTYMDRGNHRRELEALDRCKGFIRSALAQRLDIRRTPELIFKIDETEEKGRHIDDLIAMIHAQDAEKNSGSEEE